MQVTMPCFEVLSANKNGCKITLTHKAIGKAGQEVGFIYSVDSNKWIKKKYAQGDKVTDTEFVYKPESNEILLPEGAFSEEDKVTVIYEYRTYANIRKIPRPKNQWMCEFCGSVNMVEKEHDGALNCRNCGAPLVEV